MAKRGLRGREGKGGQKGDGGGAGGSRGVCVWLGGGDGAWETGWEERVTFGLASLLVSPATASLRSRMDGGVLSRSRQMLTSPRA